MKKTCRIALISAVTALTSMSVSAQEVDFSFGAHAFLDYENASIDDVEVLDDTNLRLLRLDLNATYGGLKFKSSTDVHGDDINIRDLFIEFGDQITVRAGNFKVMNGLEQQSSLYSTTFMESNSVKTINGLGRATGVALYGQVGDFLISGGVFGPDANVIDESDMYSASGRIAWYTQPFDEDSILHLGASVRYRDSNGSGRLKYAQGAFGKSAPKTITTKIGDSDMFFGLEAAYLNDGFFLQAEYAATEVNCDAGLCPSDPSENAWYVDAGYVWGGHRVYKNGLFKRTAIDSPVNSGGPGAFAIAARYDVADLSDSGVIGGTQETAILGLTWYANKYVRLMANFSHSDFEDSPAYGDGDAETFLLRAQLELY